MLGYISISVGTMVKFQMRAFYFLLYRTWMAFMGKFL